MQADHFVTVDDGLHLVVRDTFGAWEHLLRHHVVKVGADKQHRASILPEHHLLNHGHEQRHSV